MPSEYAKLAVQAESRCTDIWDNGTNGLYDSLCTDRASISLLHKT
jgi:hypothetical protein